jgi:hypothetical protein
VRLFCYWLDYNENRLACHAQVRGAERARYRTAIGRLVVKPAFKLVWLLFCNWFIASNIDNISCNCILYE